MSEQPKMYTRQAVTGDAGVALIHMRVQQMGFAWHARALDAGIDGEIELRDRESGAAMNKVLFVQSKASDSLFPGEDDTGFYYPVKRRDLDYWLQADVPVLLVCSHPREETAWWVNVTEWFADPARRQDLHVWFDKEADRFDADAGFRLLQRGAPKSAAQVEPTAGETLVSNLLEVTAIPDQLYVAPTGIRSPHEAMSRLRGRGRDAPGWLLHDRTVTSFHPLDKAPLDVLCSGAPDVIDTVEWAETDDEDLRRRFVWLLNQTLRAMHRQDLRWDRSLAHFRPGPGEGGRLEPSKSSRGREVVKAIEHKSRPGETAYVRHYAARMRFLRLARRWYLSIRPDYHFTRDGYRMLSWASDLRSGIKRRERNAAVRGQVEFWAAFLSRSPNLLDDAEAPIRFGELLHVETDRGFIDPTAPDVVDPPQTTSLFDGSSS